MKNNAQIRKYVILNIFIGLYFLVQTFIYTTGYTYAFNGTVEKTFFNVNLISLSNNVSFFNYPLVVFFVFTILNIIVGYIVSKQEDILQQLKEVAVINAVFTFTLMLGQILFVSLIPDIINGTGKDVIIYLELPRLSSDVVKVFNANYFLSFAFIVYNMFVLIKTVPEKTGPSEFDLEFEQEREEEQLLHDLNE